MFPSNILYRSYKGTERLIRWNIIFEAPTYFNDRVSELSDGHLCSNLDTTASSRHLSELSRWSQVSVLQGFCSSPLPLPSACKAMSNPKSVGGCPKTDIPIPYQRSQMLPTTVLVKSWQRCGEYNPSFYAQNHGWANVGDIVNLRAKVQSITAPEAA